MRSLCFIIVICLALCDPLAAQYMVTGGITDNRGKGIPFASVILQQSEDSSIVLTALADSLGKYRLEAQKIKQCFITASANGYISAKKMFKDEVSKKQTIDIVLGPETLVLGEVAVTVKKPLIERKIDRIIFNVENSIASIGGDALDAISKAPGVNVNGSDDISLAGKSTVSVMIDDRLIEAGGEELAEILKAIPSDNISRIDVITAPPAKYDAAGNSGIINIVTKKLKQQGLNGSIGAVGQQNSYSSARGMAAFNYRKDKLNIYGNSDFGDLYAKPVEQQTAYFPGEQWQQVNHIDNLYNYHHSQLGADYDITPKAVIGILYTYGGSMPKMIENLDGKWVSANNVIDSLVNTKAHTSSFGERNVVNLNYEWKIDSAGEKLNLNADFFTRTGRTVRDFTTTDMFADGTPTGTTSTDKSTGQQVLNTGALKADMELPTGFAKVSFGAKASFIHVTSDNVFQYLDTGSYITDLTKTNKFDYHENTQALYISAQKKLNKQWDAQAGLRGEYTQTDAASLTLAQAHKTQYFRLFPTAYVQYTPNEDNVFNLNCNRRIERPNMIMINPFRKYVTPNSYEEGNPFLQPSYSSNAEFSYTLQSKYTFTAYVQNITSAATQIMNIDTVNKGFNFTYANIGKALNYGVTASAQVSPATWWESNAQVYAFHSSVVANYYNAAVYDRYSMNGFIIDNDNTFTLDKQKTLLAECGFMYNSSLIENYNYHFPNFSFNAGMKCLLLHRNLVMALNFSDIFATEITKIRNLYNGAITNNYYDERNATLTVTWKFGNKNVKSQRERNSTMEESKRM
jgi:hypothetical protein